MKRGASTEWKGALKTGKLWAIRVAILALFLGFLRFPAFAEVKVRVLETDPSSPATSGNWENFYLHIACDTDREILVRGEAFLNGASVPGMTSGMPPCGPGAGEAMVWFSYSTQARVDKILVTARDEKTQAILAQAELPVDLSWTGQNVTEIRHSAPWVETLRAEQNRRLKTKYDAYLNSPQARTSALVGMAIIWCLPIYFILQIAMLWRLSGGWRTAAAVPLLPIGAAFAHAVYAFHAGSNIFPLVLIFASVPALIYLVILLVIRRFWAQPTS